MNLFNQLILKYGFQKTPSIKRFLCSLGVLLVLSCAVFAQEWSWKAFKPNNQPWTILAPGPMQPDEEARDPRGSKGSYSYNDYNGFFAVIYRDSPKRWLPWKPDYSGYIQDVRDDVVKANRGELVKDAEFTNRGIKGREALVKFQSGTMRSIEGQTVPKYRVQRFRMFFIGRRFYIVLAVMNESEINKPAIDNYFNSFAINSPPAASPDLYAVDEDSTLTVPAPKGVLVNDRDSEGDKLTVTAAKPVTPPAHGTLTLNADGSLSYQPEANYYGQDSFTYTANDGIIDSPPATVTIKVNPVNDPPTLSNVPPTAVIDELTAFGFTATANDIDTPPASLNFSLTGAPAGVTIDPKSGVLSWTPTESQGAGNYTFQINLSDGAAAVNAPISVTVREVNVAPQFANSNISSSTNELEPFSFAASAVDSDLPAQALTYSLAGAPEGVAINPSTGAISWTPSEAQGDNSTYKFTVRASDGALTAEATVNLTVKEVNGAPRLGAISDQTIDELKSLSVVLTGSDADLPANNLTYSLEAGAPAGMSIDPKTGAIAWTPDESQGAGDYSIKVRLTDSGTPALSDTKSFKIRVNEVNTAPKLAPIGNKTVDEETSLSFNLTATDADLPANTLNYSLINAPAGATLNPQTGAFAWTPTESQGAGSYTATFRVMDNGAPALSAEETITITVNEVNKAPIAASIAVVGTDEDASVSFALSATDPDLPANTLTYSIVSAPAHGKLSGTAPNLNYTPNPDYNGSDSFTFRVSDGSLNSAAVTVNISVKPVNDAPVASNDSASTAQETAVTVNVTANDTDVDGDKIVLTGVSNVVNGKAEIVGGAVRFTPNPGFYGAGSFSYTISDGKSGTATATVSVTVNQAKPE